MATLKYCRFDSYGSSERSIVSIVTRWIPSLSGKAQQQTLVCYSDGQLRPLLGATARGRLELGPALELFYQSPAAQQQSQPAAVGRVRWKTEDLPSVLCDAAWDAGTASLYLAWDRGIVRLSSDNVVTLVAGTLEEDGGAAGPAVCFKSIYEITTDGAGTLYVIDADCGIRRVQTTRCWAKRPTSVVQPDSGGAEDTAVEVTTLLAGIGLLALQYLPAASSPGGASLVYSSGGATVYRLPLDTTAAVAPMRVASGLGRPAARDGSLKDAALRSVTKMAASGDGCLYAVDGVADFGGVSIRKIDLRNETVTTIPGIDIGVVSCAAILPNGDLALADVDGFLHVWDLGLVPPLDVVCPPPSCRTLAADLGALLDEPNDTADLAVIVKEGTTFSVHNALLMARCDYFKMLSEFRSCSGSACGDGARLQVEMPDTDPTAFHLALRFIYTGAVDIPLENAQSLAELADLLLLPELSRAAQARILEEMRPESVVDAMLWANSRMGYGGVQGSFSQLLSDLMAWCRKHYAEVCQEAQPSLQRLADENPDLLDELMAGLEECPAGAAHTD